MPGDSASKSHNYAKSAGLKVEEFSGYMRRQGRAAARKHGRVSPTGPLPGLRNIVDQLENEPFSSAAQAARKMLCISR